MDYHLETFLISHLSYSYHAFGPSWLNAVLGFGNDWTLPKLAKDLTHTTTDPHPWHGCCSKCEALTVVLALLGLRHLSYLAFFPFLCLVGLESPKSPIIYQSDSYLYT